MNPYYEQRHVDGMKRYLVEKIGWRERERIEALSHDETYAEFRRVYNSNGREMTMTEKKKDIWRR